MNTPEDIIKEFGNYLRDYRLIGDTSRLDGPLPEAEWIEECNDFLLSTLSSYASEQAKLGKEEAEDETTASRTIWDRMTEWRREWSKAHPAQPLTWPDALKLLEWKLQVAEARGRKLGGEEKIEEFKNSKVFKEMEDKACKYDDLCK